MITKLFKYAKCAVIVLFFTFQLTSCFKDKVVKVDSVYNVSTNSLNISSESLNNASKSCVEGINTTENKRYSGVIFLEKNSKYYIALPYYDNLKYDSIVLYDKSKVAPKLVGTDLSNKLCVYTIETNLDVSVISGNTNELYKAQAVGSLSTPSDETNIASYKEGIISSLNSSYFTTDILLSEPDVGGIIINENAQMLGFVYSYSYSSDGDEIGETYSNYVKGINQSYRYEDFYKYVINIVENGTFTKGLMGITQTNNEYASFMAKKYNLDYVEPENAKGLAYIINVAGSAKEAGVRTGEFIYELNGTLVYRTTDVSHIMSFLSKGTNVLLKTIDSNGNIKSYSITLS